MTSLLHLLFKVNFNFNFRCLDDSLRVLSSGRILLLEPSSMAAVPVSLSGVKCTKTAAMSFIPQGNIESFVTQSRFINGDIHFLL